MIAAAVAAKAGVPRPVVFVLLAAGIVGLAVMAYRRAVAAARRDAAYWVSPQPRTRPR